MTSNLNRRRFMEAAAASGVFTIVPRHVLGGAGFVAPSDKITMAHIGMGTQGFNELEGLLAEPEVQIVAVCDPNKGSSDYVEWSKHSIRNTIRRILGNPSWRENDDGCPGGREVGCEVINTYYAKQREAEKFKACTSYADFRELLDKEKDLDAVKIMTPDHLHATISIAAMKKGKHVLVHKPIANRMYEARLSIETARKTKVATHLLAYGSGSANAKIVARIKEGAIGKLREIHNWSSRPFWPQYPEIPTDSPPVPEGFDWDLWLGPALDRPYHPHYTHTVFRGWYDFGGGSMADMGIYSLWPVLTALNLGAPLSAEAWSTHTCSIVDQVSREAKNDFSFPAACALRFKFAARGDMPALDLFWYDGGMKPRMPEAIEAANPEIQKEGILFIGDRGTIMAGFNGQSPRLFAKGKSEPLWPEEAEQADAGRRRRGPGGRSNVWLPSLKGGELSPGNFLNAASISDTVNLGTVALRAGTKVLFDSEAMKITNVPDANKYLHREYRPGWEL
jgi:Oxidoreductase family, C-terminal alpha/beta domain/Oxidoreductase family, NAD-binding Rossmann fold